MIALIRTALVLGLGLVVGVALERERNRAVRNRTGRIPGAQGGRLRSDGFRTESTEPTGAEGGVLAQLNSEFRRATQALNVALREALERHAARPNDDALYERSMEIAARKAELAEAHRVNVLRLAEVANAGAVVSQHASAMETEAARLKSSTTFLRDSAAVLNSASSLIGFARSAG